MYLKVSTSVDVPIGPFLDETDGKTAETALTITQPDIRLKKNGGAWAQKAAAQTLSHEEAGWYEVTLDATDTDTIGHLMVAIHESGALPVWREFHVLAANVYDSLFGAATDKLDVNVEEWNTTAVPAEHTAGYPIVTVKDGTGTGEIDTASGRVAVTEAQIDQIVDEVWDELKSAHTVADSFGDYLDDEITSRATAADVPTAAVVADAVWDEDATGHQTQGTFGQAIGDPAADADTIWGLVNTNLNATVSSRASQTSVDTIDDLVDDLESRIGTPSNLGGGATISANLSDIEAQTDDIGVAGAGLTDLGGMSSTMKSQVESEANDALIAQNLDHLVKSAVDTNFATTVQVDSVIGQLAQTADAGFDRSTDSLEAIYDNDANNGLTIGIINSGVSNIQGRLPAALSSGNMKCDVLMLSGDTSAANNAESFFDGTGYAGTNNVIPTVTNVTNGVTLAASAIQAIWDALTSALTTAGSIGKLLVDNINATISSRSTITTADVNAEVLDVLNVDTFGETSGVPSGTATLVSKLSRLYDALINGLDITSAKKKFKNAAGVAQWEKDLSDDSVTYTETAGNAP